LENIKWKICKIGHRTPKNGVITIASEVLPEENKIWYGASFCSPKEPKYIKSLGNELAIEALEHIKIQDYYITLDLEFTHSNIITSILQDMFFGYDRPSWSDNLILEQLKCPSGLIRKPEGYYNGYCELEDLFEIKELVVENEKSKEQILLALKYLKDNSEINLNFIALDSIFDLIYTPEKILIE